MQITERLPSGFSLLELVLSIGILAVMALTATKVPATAHRDLDSATERLRGLVEMTRRHAMVTGTPATMCSYNELDRHCNSWSDSVQLVSGNKVVLHMEFPGIALRFRGFSSSQRLTFTPAGDTSSGSFYICAANLDHGRRIVLSRSGRTRTHANSPDCAGQG